MTDMITIRLPQLVCVIMCCLCMSCSEKDLGIGRDVYFSENLNLPKTGLPVVMINTPDSVEIKYKSKWTEGASISIISPEGVILYTDTLLKIKGRGNMTWYDSPKKPYAIKLNKKTGILGMAEGKRWCLLANFFDRTLMRNDIAFQVAKQTGLAWTPDGKFVELVLNGKHIGNYYLCEQIKIDKNRVDIREMKSTDVDGDNISGGYLVEVDTHYDEVNKFKSLVKQFPYMFKSPDEDVLQPIQMDYFRSYIDSLEVKLYADNWLDRGQYRNYLDMKSFADYWIVSELSTNQELMHPKSLYMYKDRKGKLTAGPVWDYDCSTFCSSRTKFFIAQDDFYYERLFQDPEFVELVKSRWMSLKSKLENIPDYIRRIANLTRKSNEQNIKIWPMLDPIICNGDEEMSFEDAIENMIAAYKGKFIWMDEQISNW